MIRIVKKKTRGFRHSVTIQKNPTPGTWGCLQLLNDYFHQLEANDGNWLNTPKGRQMLFNYNFLKDMLAEHGELHCEYCGKPDLVLFHWTERCNRDTMATADHFYPRSKYPALAMNRDNMFVACDKCNNKKKAKLANFRDIQFPYFLRPLKDIVKLR